MAELTPKVLDGATKIGMSLFASIVLLVFSWFFKDFMALRDRLGLIETTQPYQQKQLDRIESKIDRLEESAKR